MDHQESGVFLNKLLYTLSKSLAGLPLKFHHIIQGFICIKGGITASAPIDSSALKDSMVLFANSFNFSTFRYIWIKEYTRSINSICATTRLNEIGIDDSRLKEMASKCSEDGTVGNFKKLDRNDILEIFKLAMK